MQAKGLKEVKKGAKLLLKKEKIDGKLKKLAEQYRNLTSPKFDEHYFLAMAEDYIKQQKK